MAPYPYRSRNPQAAAGVDAANAIKQREAIRAAVSANPNAGGVRELQAAAGQATAERGAAAVERAAQGVQAAGQAAATGLAQAQNAEAEQAADRRLRLGQRRVAFDRQLSELGLKTDQATFNASLKFQKDELGRNALNQQQLADWAVLNAQSKEDFLNKMQQVEQAHERKTALLAAARQRIEQTLKLESEGRIAALDRATKESLLQAKISLEQKMQKEAADAANRQAIWTQGGTAVGAIVGAIYGGPAGASAGGAAGGGVGSMAGAQANK